MAGAMLAADPVAPVPTAVQADISPIPADRLGVQAANGDSIPFADLLGSDGRAVCFAFLHPACPLSQGYGPVLGELAAQYADKGIRFVGVVCEYDNAAEIEDYRTTYSIPFPIYADTDFRLAEALDATITPEVVLVDRNRSIRYAGRINDRYKVRGVMSPGDPHDDLRLAIVALVAGGTTVELGLLLREAFGGDVPAEIYRRGAVVSASYNWLAAVACATMGLVVSACVRSTDKGVLAVPLLITPQILLGATILPITGGVLKVLAMLFSPLYWAHRGCRSEGQGVPEFWQNLGHYDPALWIPYAALAAQIAAATIIAILVLRWQERASRGRNRAIR